MKTIALFKAFLHWIKCGGNTIIRNSGNFQTQNLPVTKIYCEDCGKVFYSNQKSE